MPVTAGRPWNKGVLFAGRAAEAMLGSFGGLLGRGTVVIFGKQLHVLLLLGISLAINEFLDSMLRSCHAVFFLDQLSLVHLSVSPLIHWPSKGLCLFMIQKDRFRGWVTRADPIFIAKFHCQMELPNKASRRDTTARDEGWKAVMTLSLLAIGFWTPQASYFWGQDGCKGQ